MTFYLSTTFMMSLGCVDCVSFSVDFTDYAQTLDSQDPIKEGKLQPQRPQDGTMQAEEGGG